LELFHPQSEVIDWHRLPRETQRKTTTLLAHLLREQSGIQLLHSVVKESKHE
jgi:hypothetical protein